MPATRPITSESADPTKVDDPNHRALANVPFTARYDKLIIAVGAYSQSQYYPFVLMKVTHVLQPSIFLE
jgi:hypothetical protein